MSIAVVFPGQGAQTVGMGKDFYDKYESARAFFDEADKSLGYKLSDIIFNGSEEKLRLTENTQPALLTVSAAIWGVVSPKIKPSFFAGHSLGEYTAVYAAGGFPFAEAVKAVHNRGKFMQDAVPVGEGAMAAVLGLGDEEIEAACKEYSKAGAVVEPANYNCPGQVVVAGHAVAFDGFAEFIKTKGAKRVIPLSVSAPFHSSLMKSAQVKMAEYLKNISIHTLKTPVYNNVDAVCESDAKTVEDSLRRQVSAAVRWTLSVKNMVANGVDTFVEVGSGSVLSGLIKKIDANVKCVNISTVADIEKIDGITNA